MSPFPWLTSANATFTTPFVNSNSKSQIIQLKAAKLFLFSENWNNIHSLSMLPASVSAVSSYLPGEQQSNEKLFEAIAANSKMVGEFISHPDVKVLEGVKSSIAFLMEHLPKADELCSRNLAAAKMIDDHVQKKTACRADLEWTNEKEKKGAKRGEVDILPEGGGKKREHDSSEAGHLKVDDNCIHSSRLLHALASADISPNTFFYEVRADLRQRLASDLERLRSRLATAHKELEEMSRSEEAPADDGSDMFCGVDVQAAMRAIQEMELKRRRHLTRASLPSFLEMSHKSGLDFLTLDNDTLSTYLGIRQEEGVDGELGFCKGVLDEMTSSCFSIPALSYFLEGGTEADAEGRKTPRADGMELTNGDAPASSFPSYFSERGWTDVDIAFIRSLDNIDVCMDSMWSVSYWNNWHQLAHRLHSLRSDAGSSVKKRKTE
mmetsp:Transcript_31734/g.82797  ORF Transcript_31734/g.82797 Transcript_31734/m.82797 type:complete len:436 (-) Transcript_31734:424-1731(-)